MANEKPVKQRAADVFSAILVVGAMCMAIVYFGKVPILRPGGPTDKRAPDISFELPSGEKTSLSRQRGKVVLINFWASWCEPCMGEMPSLRMLEAHFARKGFLLLAFNIEETKETVRGQIQAADLPENLIFNFNKAFLRPYDVRAIPLSLLIDRDGMIHDFFSGPRNWMDTNIIREIEGLLQ